MDGHRSRPKDLGRQRKSRMPPFPVRAGGSAGWSSDFSDQPPPTRLARTGPDSLLFFYLMLLQDINTKTLVPPDLEFYWQPGP